MSTDTEAASRPRPTARRRVGRALAVGVGVIALLGACSEDGGIELPVGSAPAGGGDTGGADTGGGDTGGDTGGADTGGEDTGGGDTGEGDTGGGDTGGGDTGGGDAGGGDTGTPTPPPEPVPEDDSFTTEEWILLILLIVAVVALIIGAVAASSNHAEKKAAQRTDVQRRLRQITSGIRWVNDQAVDSVLRSNTADQLNSSWHTTRTNMLDLEAKISQASGVIGDGSLDDALGQLGRALAGLRGALESNVRLRLRDDAASQLEMIKSSTDTVMQRRQQVENALVPILAAQP